MFGKVETILPAREQSGGPATVGTGVAALVVFNVQRVFLPAPAFPP